MKSVLVPESTARGAHRAMATTHCWPASGTSKVCPPLFHRPRPRITDGACRVKTQLFAVGGLRYWIHHHWPSAVHSVCFTLHQSHELEGKLTKYTYTKLRPPIFDTIWRSVGHGLGSKWRRKEFLLLLTWSVSGRRVACSLRVLPFHWRS